MFTSFSKVLKMAEELGIGVPEFFSGQKIFVTGGTGFMGKVLIEKLLRSCPDIDKIYLLIRPKKGKSMKERLEAIYEMDLFEKLKKEQPNAFWEKIIPVAGDVAQLSLGLSEEDVETLRENVTLVYHTAATVRFDQPLKDAIIMNTRGTREICKLALEMKNLQVFTHISTAYCQVDKKVIEEKLYPPHADWRKSIEISEQMDNSYLDAITPFYMEGFPNTYTFTKSLAEHVVHDLLNGIVPNVILRPTVVLCTQKDPFPGWIDNFNGPVGLIAGYATGLLRIGLFSKEVINDYVVVDMAIKVFILAAWQQGTTHSEDRNITKVYNCNSLGRSINDILEKGLEIGREIPMRYIIWYPDVYTTTNTTVYYICLLCLHVLPAIFLDSLLKLFNRKPMILRIQKKVYMVSMALKHFVLNDWEVRYDEMRQLENKLLRKDVKDFGYDFDNLSFEGLFRSAAYGAKKWLFKENMDDIKNDQTRFKILYYLHYTIKYGFYGLVAYYLLINKVPVIIYDFFYKYVESLESISRKNM